MQQPDRLDALTKKVRHLYEAKDPARGDWADWLYEYHIFVVVTQAKELAERYGANAELAQAGALLHDIADSRMSRFDPAHEETSLAIARECLQACGYTPAEIQLVVDDAMRLHACHNGQKPASKEGLVLATADALAHLTTDYYLRATTMLAHEGKPLQDIKTWVLKKIDRDFQNKIHFDDARHEARPHHQAIQEFYSRTSNNT